MTTPSGPPSDPNAQGPRQPNAGRNVKPLAVVAATVAAILLTALLNCEQLVTTAKRLPFGTERTIALRIAEDNRDVARFLWLDRTRHRLDVAFGHAPSPVPTFSPQPSPSPSTVPSGSPSPSPSPSPSATASHPTATHPLRLYIGGDSMAEQVGEGFLQLEAPDKRVRVQADGRASTGLTRPDYFDWPARLMAVLAEKPAPQVLIMMFGANDAQPIMTSHGPAGAGSAAWRSEYRSRVARVMSLLAASGDDVYWLGQPLTRSTSFNQYMSMLDAIYSSEASQHPPLTFVDTRPLLADSHGHYADYLPDRDGSPVLMRASDGIHLSLAGTRRVAAAVMALIKKRSGLS